MKSTVISMKTVLLLVILLAQTIHAADYHVSKTGSDDNDGLTMQNAYASLQKGLDALQPGDTLVIAPGEYHQSMQRDNLGSMEAQTTIRAQIPGTVVLRGDVTGPSFTKVPGKRFVYEADYDAKVHGQPQAMIEHATRSMLAYTADIAELEFIPGLFVHDEKAGKIYLSTADMEPATGRLYSIMVMDVSGIYLNKPQRVTIEGIAVTGFFLIGTKRDGPYLWKMPWGIALVEARNTIVRNCTTYFNAGGIASDTGTNVLIEKCVSFGNNSNYQALSGNIISFGGRYGAESSGVLIRDCKSYEGGMGIHQYGGMKGPTVISRNMSWGNQGGDIHVKTGMDDDNRKYGMIENSIAFDGHMGGRTTRHNLFLGHGQYPSLGDTDIRGVDYEEFNYDKEMADPENLDFRLQQDSQFRNAAEDGRDKGPHQYNADIFYVKHDGDDSATGLSMNSAWRTLAHAIEQLKPGDTLYISAGTYTQSLTFENVGAMDQPVYIRGRGRENVVIQGDVSVTGAGAIAVERLIFENKVAIENSSNVVLKNTTFRNGLDVSSVQGMELKHCEFPKSSINIKSSVDVVMAGNHFAGTSGASVIIDSIKSVKYSDYNGYENVASAWSINGKIKSLDALQTAHDIYSIQVPTDAEASFLAGRGPLGQGLGIYHERKIAEKSLKLIGPMVHSVTDTTVNIEWWTTGPTALTVHWGKTPKMENSESIETHRFGTYSLTGLEPGVTYYFKLDAHAMPGQGEVLQFTTEKSPREARVHHVAPDGNDTHSGKSKAEAWQTIHHAASQVRPGDTVLLHEGTYETSVRVRVTGEKGRPVTFKSAPGEKVVFSGVDRTLTFAFLVSGKHYLNFDGVYFTWYNVRGGMQPFPWTDRNPGNSDSGILTLYRSSHVQITRCFNDGRGGGYAPGLIWAVGSPDISIRNSVNTMTMGNLGIFFSCDNLLVENNVSIGNYITNHVIVNEPTQKFTLRNNIYTDSSLPKKVNAHLFELGNVESLVESNNCYFLRIPDDEKKLFMFYGPVAYDRCADGYLMKKEFEKPLHFQDITRLSLADYQKEFNPTSGSFIADPQFVAAKGLDATFKDGTPRLVTDIIVGLDDLDFPGLFATNSRVIEQGIGLQRDAFNDFHFNQKISSN